MCLLLFRKKNFRSVAPVIYPCLPVKERVDGLMQSNLELGAVDEAVLRLSSHCHQCSQICLKTLLSHLVTSVCTCFKKEAKL